MAQSTTTVNQEQPPTTTQQQQASQDHPQPLPKIQQLDFQTKSVELAPQTTIKPTI